MSGNPVTYGELLARATKICGAKFDAGQLFTHVTQKHLIHMSFLSEKAVPQAQVDILLKLCERRKKGEPLQYLLGEWEFYSLPFKVGEGVLIPRADTECLVDVALEVMREVASPAVLDLCSGTGCVAVAIAHNRADAKVIALEVSDKAFPYLKQNIALNNVRVNAVKADLKTFSSPRPFDLIVSNPPYIPREVISTLQVEVRHEPKRALDGGNDGLFFYRLIADLYKSQLKQGGWLCLEVGIGQSIKVQEILANNGYQSIGVKDDYSGIQRVVYAQRGNV